MATTAPVLVPPSPTPAPTDAAETRGVPEAVRRQMIAAYGRAVVTCLNRMADEAAQREEVNTGQSRRQKDEPISR